MGNEHNILSLTIGYSIFQVIFFLTFLYFIVVSIWKYIFQIKNTSQFIEKRLKDENELSEIRREIDNSLTKKSGWMIDQYIEFKLSWSDARIPGLETAIIPIRLKDYLSPEIVLDGACNRRIAGALPGILIALGIFGTFLGLMLGLYGLDLDEIDQLKKGLEHLISGLSLAFRTSLLGIFLSILFSLSYKYSIRKLEKEFLELDERIARIFPFQSYEKSVRNYYQLQKDVKHGLQTLATDVATKITDTIAPAVGTALEEHLVPVLKSISSFMQEKMEEDRRQQNEVLEGFNEQLLKMSDIIKDHFENSQQEQAEAMQSVLEQYVEKMNGAFQQQFGDMGRIIEETTKAQADIKEQMMDFAVHMQNQFEVQKELISKTSRAGEILGQSLEDLEFISDRLKSSSEKIAEAATTLEKSAERAMEGQDVLRSSMEQQIAAMNETTEQLGQTWGKITGEAQDVVEYTRQSIKELAEGVGENMVNALTTFDGKVAEVIERFSGTIFEAGQTINELPAILTDVEEKLSSISATFDENKDVLNEMNTVTKNVVSDSVQKAVEASVRLNESASKLADVNVLLQDFFQDLYLKLNSGFKKWGSEIKLAEPIEMLSGKIEQLSEIKYDNKNSEELSNQIKEILTSNLSNISEHINVLTAKFVKEIAPNVIAMNEQLTLLTKEMTELKNSSESMHKHTEEKTSLFKRMIGR